MSELFKPIVVQVDSEAIRDYLKAEAVVRGISTTRMMSLLLTAVQHYDLMTDILQDKGVVYPKPTRVRRAVYAQETKLEGRGKHSNIREELAALRKRLGIPQPRGSERTLNSRVVQARDMRKSRVATFVPQNRAESEADLRQAVKNTAGL